MSKANLSASDIGYILFLNLYENCNNVTYVIENLPIILISALVRRMGGQLVRNMTEE